MHIHLGNLGSIVGLLAACVLAAACAASERPLDNGQSHWLQSCETDADCNGLSCLCGLCTTACREDSECGLHAGGDAVCRSGDALPNAGSCGSDSVALSLCFPAALIVREDAMVSVALPHDAAVESVTTPPSGIPTHRASPLLDGACRRPFMRALPTPVVDTALRPLHVDCAGIDTNQLPVGVEHIGGQGLVDGLTAIGTAISGPTIRRPPLSGRTFGRIELLARDANSPLLADGEILFFGSMRRNAGHASKVSLTDHERGLSSSSRSSTLALLLSTTTPSIGPPI